MKKSLSLSFLFILTLTLSSCWRIVDYAQRKKRHFQMEHQFKKMHRTWQEVQNISDTMLLVRCTGYRLCDSSVIMNRYCIYPNQNITEVIKVKFGSPWYIAPTYTSHEFENGFSFLESVFNSGLDTVRSFPKPDWDMSHCGGLKIELIVDKDTIIDQYFREPELLHYDYGLGDVGAKKKEHHYQRVAHTLIEALEKFERRTRSATR